MEAYIPYMDVLGNRFLEVQVLTTPNATPFGLRLTPVALPLEKAITICAKRTSLAQWLCFFTALVLKGENHCHEWDFT